MDGVSVPGPSATMLGTAYRRSQEYTCDRYGVRCCSTDENVRAALAAMSAGNTRWKELNTAEYLEQIPATSGFWMSFHEFTSDYPWLTKRMANALAFRRNEEISHPGRSFFAGFLSIFVPRIAVGGGASLLLTVAIIAILAAIAVLCLNHGIALTPSSPRTAKRDCSICTSPSRDDSTLSDCSGILA